MATAASHSMRALPSPALDPCDVAALMPDVDSEDVERGVVLATLAVQAAIWPNELPPPPLPAPLAAVLLSISARLATSPTPGTPQVVSESLGSYSWRAANPPTLDAALALSDGELDALAPWMPAAKRGAYELTTLPAGPVWPVDWWQRDLDNV